MASLLNWKRVALEADGCSRSELGTTAVQTREACGKLIENRYALCCQHEWLDEASNSIQADRTYSR